jgi:death-on-curing protein
LQKSLKFINHPFVDGNKRVGALSALVFLLLNGYEFEAPEDEFAEIVLSVARGEIDQADVAVFIHRWSKPS